MRLPYLCDLTRNGKQKRELTEGLHKRCFTLLLSDIPQKRSSYHFKAFP